MTQSEESITLMTFYSFPHHGNRSFAVASGWRFTGSLITGTNSSLALIMTFYRTWSFWTGIRMFCGKNGKAERWHKVKNLLLWWHFTAFLTTAIDPSLSLQDDALPAPSLRVQILRWHSGWGPVISVAFAGKSKRRVMISFLNPIYNFTRIGEHKESISLCFFWRDKGRWLVLSEKETWLLPFSYSQVKTRDRITITG